MGCEKKFQAKKLLYNHVQSIHLGEKTNCPDCKKDISVDNFSRHVRETHERIKKPCPHCEKEFAMSNLSRHIRQVHNNESTECPDCGKALTISNLNKHIKSVHKKLKKTCDICNEEVPYSSISVHKRKVHNIGKPIDDVTPRGPNLKLRKRYQQMQNQEEEFDKLTEDDGTPVRSHPETRRRRTPPTRRISTRKAWRILTWRRERKRWEAELFKLETKISHSLLHEQEIKCRRSSCACIWAQCTLSPQLLVFGSLYIPTYLSPLVHFSLWDMRPCHLECSQE